MSFMKEHYTEPISFEEKISIFNFVVGERCQLSQFSQIPS